jgi:anti-sigma regulatory factor (Ser/Thr protein kinase)
LGLNQLSLHSSSDPAELAPVRRAVEAFCAACGLSEQAVAETGLCVNEAMANITRHAYQGAADKPIVLDARYEADELKLTLRDWGCGRDPSKLPPKVDPLTPGGLGMVCLKTLMNVKFTPLPDGMLLTMSRRRGDGERRDEKCRI